MKKILLFLFLLLNFTTVFSQTKHYEIKWNLSKIDIKNSAPDSYILFQANHYNYAFSNILFSDKWMEDIPVKENSVIVKNLKYSKIDKRIVEFFIKNKIQKKFVPIIKSTYGRNILFTSFSINTIILKNKTYYKLDSFDIYFSHEKKSLKPHSQNIYDSKLATGEWYRFKIKKTGVYKITKKFLKDLDIDVDNVNPKNIKIFGNGAALMPLRNVIPFPEDISELAVEVVGEQDGHFDDYDYILFFAQGPKWNVNNDTNHNIYTDDFYYYIKIDNSPGKRMSPYVSPAGSVIKTFDDYSVHKFYEKDETNFTRFGRKFYEKPFSNSNKTKEIEFNFTNLVTSKPIYYTLKGASDFVGAATNFTLKLNGDLLGTATLFINSENTTLVGDEEKISGNTNVSTEKLKFQITYNDNGNFDARFYLNYLNVNAYCKLKGIGKQFIFFNNDVNGIGVGKYVLTNAKDIEEIWDITDIYNPTYIHNSANSVDIKFELESQKKFLAIDKTDLFLPVKTDNPKMENQNLHKDVFYHTGSFKDIDMLIITPSFLHNKAEELADMHRQINQNTYVADLDKIYNEFGTGSQDIAAIRNFVKYIYNNASSPEKKLKYLLMFGDASVDYKGLLEDYQLTDGVNSNIVPIYERLNGLSNHYSNCSDDFFVLLDENEGSVNFKENPDVAVGRLIIRNEHEAEVLINKYKHYFSDISLKPWRTNIGLWSDDWDNHSDGFILNMENVVAANIQQYHPEFNLQKIYQDAYTQINTSGGERYPVAKRDLLNLFEKGVLMITYVGHGNEHLLSHEKMLTKDDILQMQNYDKLNMFIALTCEFGRFDNPSLDTAAEEMIRSKKGGCLTMIASNRSIGISNANNFNIAYHKCLLGTSPSFNGEITYNPAEALRKAKTITDNFDKFLVSFLGDPGFDLGLPKPKIVLTEVNGKPTDTLKALEHVIVKGEIRNKHNQLLTSYSGNVYPIIFDKYQQAHTLLNDGTGEGQVSVDFKKLGKTIFKGKAKVQEGKFQFEFIVPRDINMSYGKGRISFYAENGSKDKVGYDESITVGGISNNAEEDNIPPEVKLYMNNTDFVDGGVTDKNPYILVHLEDEHGINTVGGVGHDITAIIDDNSQDMFVLNDFYEAENNTYKKGNVKYRLLDLDSGWHTLTVKAWDVYNNSSIAKISFQVVSGEEIKLERVLNYPNPFINYTEFWFNHNHPFEDLDVMIQVFSISGKLVWEHRQTVMTTGFLSRDITWDGRDNFGNKLAKGVYVYKLIVRTQTGKTAEKIEKLVVL